MTATPEGLAASDLPSGGGLDRNIALELCRVTEAAALAAARWMGRGNKNALDQAAVNAMRDRLKVIQMDGVVVIGEGEKDEAPMLYIGERIGNGQDPKVDVAVDPVDGTTLLSKGLPNAVAVVALAERGTMYYPPGIVYMEKIAVGPAGRGVVLARDERRGEHRSAGQRQGRAGRRSDHRRPGSAAACRADRSHPRHRARASS